MATTKIVSKMANQHSRKTQALIQMRVHHQLSTTSLKRRKTNIQTSNSQDHQLQEISSKILGAAYQT